MQHSMPRISDDRHRLEQSEADVPALTPVKRHPAPRVRRSRAGRHGDHL